MRRILLVSACLGILVFAGAGTALARGPHHRPPAARYGYGRGPHHRPPAVRYGYGHGPHRGRWHSGYRHGYRPYCAPYRRYAAYPGPGYGVYPQSGFGVAGRNFSFWLQR